MDKTLLTYPAQCKKFLLARRYAQPAKAITSPKKRELLVTRTDARNWLK